MCVCEEEGRCGRGERDDFMLSLIRGHWEVGLASYLGAPIMVLFTQYKRCRMRKRGGILRIESL